MKGCVYNIWSPKTDKVYVGSTTRLVEERFYDHLKHYNHYNNGNLNNDEKI
jgi:hypothetical protein